VKPIPIAQYLNQQGRFAPSAARMIPVEAPQAPKPRAASPPEDLEQQIDRAFEQARQQGLAAARSEMEVALAKDRAERDERELADRLAFRATEYAKLASKITEGLKEIETKTADSVARILKPYLTELHQKQAEQALLDCLSSILTSRSQDLVKIVGPKEKLDQLAQKLSPYTVSIEYAPSDVIDFSVVAQHTVFETQMAAFVTALDALSE
jgi:ATP phosphoribosyltransferase